MIGPYVHNIDPVIAKVFGIYLWWYGLSYSLGFIGLFFWLKRNREKVFLGMGKVYALSIFIAVGVLLGGRLVEVVFYEWAYYGEHLWHIPAVWLGGMSTHGILSGSILAILLFCLLNRRSFFEITDVLAIAGAYIMGMGRIGNFIDGQIVGSVTDAWWGVHFPDVDGFRHPVVLYDGLKNLLLIPFLLWIRSLAPPRGVLTAHFILWYGFLRIFIDFFREYRSDFLGFPPGQEFNILMTVIGSAMLLYFYRKDRKIIIAAPTVHLSRTGNREVSIRWRRAPFILLVIFPAIIPSDWTQDVPERYGKRHPGMEHSAIYPRVE